MTALFSSTESAGKQLPSESILPPSGHCVCQSGEEANVGNIRVSGKAGIGDNERELHITACARLMEMAMLRWHESGNFADRGEADRWRLLMEEAIKGRSAKQVARMERERGLA